MQIAFELVLFTEDLCRGEQFIHRADASCRNAGAKEDTLSESTLMHFAEQAGELVRLEGSTPKIAPRPERTVETVALTGRREQSLEQDNLLPVRELGSMSYCIVILFGRITSWRTRVDLRLAIGFKLHLGG